MLFLPFVAIDRTFEFKSSLLLHLFTFVFFFFFRSPFYSDSIIFFLWHLFTFEWFVSSFFIHFFLPHIDMHWIFAKLHAYKSTHSFQMHTQTPISITIILLVSSLWLKCVYEPFCRRRQRCCVYAKCVHVLSRQHAQKYSLRSRTTHAKSDFKQFIHTPPFHISDACGMYEYENMTWDVCVSVVSSFVYWCLAF